jgi:dTDP-4-dehydrorhamnose 3,5-epimerase
VTFASISGVVAAPLQVFSDDRGWGVEIARADAFPTTFLQLNHSHSRAGVLRGLHYHRHQADLWYVTRGAMQVALVDLRRRTDSPPVAIGTLTPDEPVALYVPPGVAHGYLALTEVDVVYWLAQYYDSSDEHGIAWNDRALAIPWQSESPVVSDRDAHNPELRWDDIPLFT